MPDSYPYVCLSRDPRHRALHGQPCRVIDSRTRAVAQRVLVEFRDGTRATVHSATIRRRLPQDPHRVRQRKGVAQ